jgi:exodeoxyribonuclease VII large subunit
MLRAERLKIVQASERTTALMARAARALAGVIEKRRVRFAGQAQLLDSLGYKAVLGRGYALVRDASGKPVRGVAGAPAGAAIRIELADGEVAATIDGGAVPRAPARKAAAPSQGGLFD